MIRRTLAFIIAAAALLPAAMELRAAPTQVQPPSIVGSWQSTINHGPGRPKLEALHTFTTDGGVIGSYAVPVTSQLQTTGSGTEAHGTWRQLGPGRFSYSAVGLEIDRQGRYGGLFKDSATLTIGSGGNTAQGQETFTIGAANGRVIVAGRATFTETRIRI